MLVGQAGPLWQLQGCDVGLIERMGSHERPVRFHARCNRRSAPGHHDRPGAGRRQCRRHRPCRGRSAARTPRARHPGRHRRGDGLRLAFAAVALQLLEIVGLLLAGGILLLWVCWKMWRELRGQRGAEVRRGRRTLRAQDIRAGRLADRASPTSPCRSITCWLWRVLRATIPGPWYSGWGFRSC